MSREPAGDNPTHCGVVLGCGVVVIADCGLKGQHGLPDSASGYGVRPHP
jgi:hypothetical protein